MSGGKGFTRMPHPPEYYSRLIQCLDDQVALAESDLMARLLDLDFLSSAPEVATLYTATFLLRQAGELRIEFPNVTKTNYENLIDSLKDEPSFQSIILWTMVNSSDAGLYLIFLFNKGYKRSSEILNMMLRDDYKFSPVYMNNFLFNLMRVFGLPHETLKKLIRERDNIELWAPYLHRLCENPELVREFLKTKPKKIKFYGGETNTILNMYDPLISTNDVLSRFNREADIYYDLGGGFGTPEIARLFKLPFISADINSPYVAEHDDKLVFLKDIGGKTRVLLSPEERAAYVELLGKTRYLQFDVTKDDFPTKYGSYGIVSTGFLTSTVKPQIKNLKHMLPKRGTAHLVTAWLAFSRICRLAQLGKDVDLFTIQRATKKAYAYKTVYIKWRSGRVVDLTTTLDKVNMIEGYKKRQERVRKLLDPSRSTFNTHYNRLEYRQRM
jgi:hypothetical protein